MASDPRRDVGSQATDSVVQQLIDEVRAGVPSARDTLLARTEGRLRRLTARMLEGNQALLRWETVEDVHQEALMRLDRALKSMEVPTTAAFFGLAAQQVRRALVDLARHHFGPEGQGAHHSTIADNVSRDDRLAMARDSVTMSSDSGRLMAWSEFHHQVEGLDEEQRQVVELIWYGGMSQAEAAQVLGVSERTVMRRWLAARVCLVRTLGPTLADLLGREIAPDVRGPNERPGLPGAAPSRGTYPAGS
jgi:RNA polymerase sigma-70 factor (ECF subfamily)